MESFNIKDVQREIERKEGIVDFFQNVFHNIGEDEYIRISRFYNGNNKVGFYKHIDNIANNVYASALNCDSYFNLCSTKENNGLADGMLNRYTISLDFDLKDHLNITQDDINSMTREQHKACKSDLLDTVIQKLKEINLFAHYIIDSGNGIHIHILIEKTNDFEKVEQVQKSLCEKLNGDFAAIKSTQILRIPYTYNRKNPKSFQLVKVIMDNTKHQKFRRYTIDQLHSRYVLGINKSSKTVKDVEITISNAVKTTSMPVCIENILNNGSIEGNRNADLQKIVVTFKRRNMYINEILDIIHSWNSKNNPPLNDNELEYQTNYMFDNLSQCTYGCEQCEYKGECFSSVNSDFNFDSLHDEDGVIYNTYKLEDKITKKIRNKQQKKGGKMISGNEVLILNVLRNCFENPLPAEKNGLTIKMVKRLITYKKKACISDPVLRSTLDSLLDKDYISMNKVGREFCYKFNPIRCSTDKTIRISYLATVMCICGNITPSELSLYIMMRRLQKDQLLNGQTKGNLFTFNQTELAKIYYGSESKECNQSHISTMIDNLISCKMLDIYTTTSSKNNGYEYYTYRLNS